MSDDSESKEIKFNLNLSDRLELLVNNRYLSDIEFLIGEESVRMYGHKSIITVASEMFYAMFNGAFMEATNDNKEHPIIISDIEPDIFLEILRYMYCEKVKVTKENVVELYYGSQKYLLKNLNEICESFFRNEITINNALNIFQDNRGQEFSMINDLCLNVICDNPLKCFRHEDFYVLDWMSLKLIMKSEAINCSELQLIDALEEWSKTHESEHEGQQVLKDIILNQKKRGYKCRKLNFFGPFHYDPNIVLRVKLTPLKSMKLYGLGILIGTDTDIRKPTVVQFKITIQSQIKASLIKVLTVEAELKPDLYIHEAMFETLDLVSDLSYTIAIENDGQSNYMLFCLNEFKPILDDHITVEKCNYLQGNIISYFLYN